ncbi:hypothetical protein BDV12DRAFT_190487 [Aspergillus spectabilis]
MESRVKSRRRNGSAHGKSPKAVRSPYTTEACQECRRRRAKCDGAKPLCARCLRHGIECKFTGRDDSRGTAPKSLVILLQSRVELLEQVLWLHSIDVNASIAQLQAGKTPLPGGSGTADNRTSSLTAQATPQAPEPDGALCSKETFGVEGDGEVSYFGPSSGRVELLQSNGAMSPTPPVRSRLNQFCQEIESTPDISDELKEHLIALYFKWEQPWCQLVDERLFRQSMQNKGRYFSPLLLNCILAVGSRYSGRLEVRSVGADPNTAGQTFLEIAEVLLHFDLQHPSITTIQSLGTLAIMYVATGSDSKGWLRHGMAVRLALDMGLNLDCSVLDKSRLLPDVERKLRRQIYWALYCIDKLWASYTGRICTMLDSQASVQLPLPAPATPDSPQGRETLSVLLHSLSTQCQILEKILMSLYAPKKLPMGIQRQTFFDSCLLELKSWKYRLPADLQTKPPVLSKTQILPHVYILHMVYHTSIIMLAKPFLARRQVQSTAEPSPESQGRGQAYLMTTKVATLCMEAAREICLLGEQYRKVFGSFRQSPVTATHCTLSADEEEGEAISKEIAKLVNSCVVTLSELSHSWMPAHYYWKAVFSIVKDCQRLQERKPVTASSPGVVSPPPCSSLAVPDLDLERSGGPVWERALDEGEAITGGLQDIGMWGNPGNCSFLGLEGDSFFDELMIDFPHSLDLFPGNAASGFEF